MLNEFEKYMKDNLESARSSWDKEALWEDIEKQLPSKRRAWLPVILVSGLVGISLAYLAYTTLLERQGEHIVKQDEFYAAELNNTNETSTLDSRSINADELSSSSSAPLSSNTDLNINTNYESNTSIKDENVLAVETSDDKKVLKDAMDLVHTKALDIDLEDAESLMLKDALGVNVNADGTVPIQNSLKAFPTLDHLNIQMMDPKFSLPLAPPLSANEIEVSAKTKRRMALGLIAGAGLSYRTLDAGSNSDLLSVRENAEQQLENVFASAHINYFITNRWSVEFGFEWRQITERMNYTEIETSVESKYIDTAQYYTNFMGQLAYNGKEVDVITRRQRENVLYNKHVQILMPIHLGYTHKVSRLGISLTAGPVISLMRNYKGARITEDLGLEKSLDINASGGSVLHGFDLGFSTSLDVGAHYALLMGVNYRRALSSYTIDNIGNQSYDLLDARLGLLIHLN